MAKVKVEPLVVTDENTLNIALGSIRVLQSNIDAVNAQLEADVVQLQTERGATIQGDKEEKQRLESEIERFCTENKSALFSDKKSIKLTNGTVSFKKSSDKVVLMKNFSIEKVIENLKKSKYAKLFLRTQPELNKEAVMAAYNVTKSMSKSELNNYGIDIENGIDKFSYKTLEVKG